MSIKGIDSQIMIARTADISRDTSAMLKKAEITQDYLAVREKINEAQEQSRVAKTLEAKLSELHPDDGGGSGAGYGDGGEGSDRGKADSGQDPDMLVPPGDNVIDIRV